MLLARADDAGAGVGRNATSADGIAPLVLFTNPSAGTAALARAVVGIASETVGAQETLAEVLGGDTSTAGGIADLFLTTELSGRPAASALTVTLGAERSGRTLHALAGVPRTAGRGKDQ